MIGLSRSLKLHFDFVLTLIQATEVFQVLIMSSKATRSRPLKDPNGGLTAAGRKAFNKKDGSKLKPGVKGAADSPAKMLRKGSFLRRHYVTLRGPLIDEAGKPTRLALQARAWGEAVPKSAAAAHRLAEKGLKLLKRYKKAKVKSA